MAKIALLLLLVALVGLGFFSGYRLVEKRFGWYMVLIPLGVIILIIELRGGLDTPWSPVLFTTIFFIGGVLLGAIIRFILSLKGIPIDSN